MKGKISYAALLVLALGAGIAQARHLCRTVCEPICEPAPPVCTKTIMVPKTIHVPQVVEVPARRIEIPQCDIIEHIPQPPRKILIKQPPIPQCDIVKFECVPDKIVHHPQPPLVRYECPPDADPCPPRANHCGTPCC